MGQAEIINILLGILIGVVAFYAKKGAEEMDGLNKTLIKVVEAQGWHWREIEKANKKIDQVDKKVISLQKGAQNAKKRIG